MPPDRRTTILLLTLLGIGVVVAYLPALRAGFIWDDDAYVENNVPLRTIGGILRIWFEPLSIPQYYPLTHTTFWLEYRLWGAAPFGYHLVNVLLHLTSTVLLFHVVRRLELPGAMLAAAVFALHPVMVESVAWVTERKNALSMVFYLSSALVYLGYAETRRRRSWWLAFGLFAAALMSKSVTFSLPFALLLVAWWKHGRLSRLEVVPLVPFMLLGVAYGIVTALIEKTHVLATGPEWDFSVAERFLIAGRVPWFYLSKLVWPLELTFIYPKWKLDPAAAWQWAFPAATVGLIVVLVVLRGRWGRGPLAAVLIFGGTLFPALGFLDVYPFRYSFVADHFQYHASVALIVAGAAWFVRRVPRRVGVPVALLVLALLGAKTFSQCRVYESREVLYESILADDPNSAFAYNNLAQIYAARGEEARALRFYRRCKELNPHIGPGANVNPDAFAHCMVGVGLGTTHNLGPAADAMRAGRADEAYRLRRERDPWMAKVVRYFEEAYRLAPDYTEAMNDCATAYAVWGRLTEDHDLAVERLRGAVRALEQAKRIEPENRSLYVLLHNLHADIADRFDAAGDPVAAARHRAQARRLRETAPRKE